MSPPLTARAETTSRPSAADSAALRGASIRPLRSPAPRPSRLGRARFARQPLEQAAAGALADVEHLVEPAGATVVGVGHLGLGRRARIERTEQRHLRPITPVAGELQELVSVGA